MKKFFALLLALVCLLNIASAAFTDEAQITESYREAVTAMSEKGIINGFTDGSFQPKGTLTRAQAAKIICVMLGAENKTAKAAGFSDVPATHWAAKFVDYCAEKGIVAGVGNGKFDPDGKLTGYAFGKMLLVAYGADAEKDGLTGSGWDTNTLNALTAKGRTAGVAVSGSDMTREEACQLAYNFIAVPEGYAETTVSFKEETSLYKTYSRTYMVEDGLNVDWATAGVEFIAECAGDMYLTYSSGERGYLQVYVDGAEGIRARTATGSNRKVKIAENLEPGEHTIRIVREHDISYKGITMTWHNVTFTGKKESVKAAPNKDLYIEFMGASVLVGKGALVEHLGADKVYSSDDPSHSGTHGFPYLTAQLLDADWSVVARGSVGFVRTTSSVPYTLSQLYDYVNPFLAEQTKYDFAAARKPDVVVVQCGGNDSCTEEEFRAAYKELMTKIRTYYGEDIPIVLSYNNMVAKWNSVLKDISDEMGIPSVKVTKNNDGGASKTSNPGHPSAEGQAVAAEQIAAKVKEVLKLQ